MQWLAARDGLMAVALSGAQHSALTRFFLTVRPLRARLPWPLYTQKHWPTVGHMSPWATLPVRWQVNANLSGQEEKKEK